MFRALTRHIDVSTWPLALLNGLAGRASIHRQFDIPYGSDPRQRLDVYAPHENRAEAPVVVFFYGGGWESGDRGMYGFVGAALAAKGITTVIPDYRVYPQARFPTFIEDGAAAVRWTMENVVSDGKRRRVVLVGHSAGAYLAAMLALNRTWLEAEGINASEAIGGFAGLAGPYDFLPVKPGVLRSIFGEDAPRTTQPIHFVDQFAPPALLGAPVKDSVVSPGNTERLSERLRAAGVPVSVKHYAKASHISLVGAFSPLLRFIAPVRDDVVDFVFRHC